MIRVKSFVTVLHQTLSSGVAEPSSFFHSEFLVLILNCIVYYVFIIIVSLVMLVHHVIIVVLFSFLFLWRLCSIYELFNYDRCASYDALGAAQLSGSVALFSNL